MITVNGEPWGLYLAVEGVEDSFLRRNYGTDHGDLYKPDSLSFGGGRGNGMDFNMDDFMNSMEDSESGSESEKDTSSSEDSSNSGWGNMQIPGDFTGQMPSGSGNTFPGGSFGGGSAPSLSGSGSSLVPILISLVVLAIGLIVAFTYKRR